MNYGKLLHLRKYLGMKVSNYDRIKRFARAATSLEVLESMLIGYLETVAR